MKNITIASVCAVLAVAISTSLTSVSYAHLRSSGFERAPPSLLPNLAPVTPASGGSLLDKEIAMLTGRGISPARAWQAIHVQGVIAQASLVSKVETALGKAFAGVWFEPAAAQLHIGVTSNASSRVAEGVIARDAPAGEVTVTPVRSTMAQLLATQIRWNRKLTRLFRREEVETGLDPRHNTVSIILSSAVPSRERTALEHEASRSDVNVSVTVVPNSNISVTPEAKTACKKWEAGKAYCNRSITPGVTIVKEKKPECTAGPVGINEKKERILITAGHCIEKENEEWSAINKAEEESVLGQAGRFFRGSENAGEKVGDYGEISIRAGWQTGKPRNPVFAVSARWLFMNKNKEENSYPVVGEQAPQVGNTSCLVGQNTGESCGKVKMLNVTQMGGGKFKEGLVEVEEATSIGGDSGGPWIFLTESEEIRMQGSHVGKNNALTNPVYEPLKQPVANAAEGSLEGLHLVLLTTANEGRNRFVVEGKELAKATAVEGTSATSVLKSKVAKEEVIIECKKDTLSGEIESEGKSKGSASLKECSVAKPVGCGVEPFEFKFNDQLVGSEEAEDEFKPSVGTTFVEIEITKCLLKGKYKVEGTQKCTLGGKAAEEEKEIHEVSCSPTGSKLTFGKEAASFESTEKVKLTSKAKWSIG
jgi:hypothetical protein